MTQNIMVSPSGGEWSLVATQGNILVSLVPASSVVGSLVGMLPPVNTAVAGAPGSGRLIDIPGAFLTNGTIVWVNSKRRFYAWDASSSATANPAGEQTILALADGTNPGRFDSLDGTTDGTHWALQTAWEITSSGVNDNDGSPGHPITPGELARRIGTAPIGQATTITAPTGLLPDVAMYGHFRLAPGGNVTISTTPTLLQAASTFTAGTAQFNRATPAPTTIVDAAVASFAGFVGKRIRITASATPTKIGATCFIQRAPSANTCNTTPLAVVSATPHVNPPTIFAPVAGDTYVIEDLPVLNIGLLQFSLIADSSVALNTTYVFVVDTTLRGFAASIGTLESLDRVPIVLSANVLDGLFLKGPEQSNFMHFLQACLLGGSVACTFASNVIARAGGQLRTPGWNGQVFLDLDYYAEGSALTSTLSVGTYILDGVCCFRAPGDAITLNPGVTVKQGSVGSGTKLVYGNGSTGVGVAARSGGQFIYDASAGGPPTITGAVGDTTIAAIVTSWAAINGAGGIVNANNGATIAPLL